MDNCNLDSYILELLKYKVVNNNHHDGDLYEHSVWTAKCLEKWLKEDNKWVKDIKLSKKLIILSGLFHDIGKVGINPLYGNKKSNYTYNFKHGHEDEGFKIMSGKKSINIDERINQFNKVLSKENLRKYLRKNCDISDLEYSVIAVTGGMHYELGNIMIQIENENRNMRKTDAISYILKFLNFIKDKGLPYRFKLNNEYGLSINILRLCLAVSAADVKGSKPLLDDNNELYKSSSFYFMNSDKIKKGITEKKNNGYYKYGYNTKGLRLAENIIDIYKNNKNMFV